MIDLNESLQERCSKKEILRLANYVNGDKKAYKKLINIIYAGDRPSAQYGAWVLQHSADMQPDLIIPFLKPLLDTLAANPHNGVKRAILRSLGLIELPADHLDQTVDLCFQFLESFQEPIAVKMFSMVVLWDNCQHEEVLLDELARLLEMQLPLASAGFKSRAHKILRALAKRRK